MNRRFTSTFLPDCTMPAPFAWLPAFNTDGGEGGGGGVTPPIEPAKGDSGEAKVGPNGYPLNTPVAEMTVEHAGNYWKHQARKHEDSAKTLKTELATLKPRADQFAALEEASRTESERAIEAARKEARAAAITETEDAARAKYGSVLVGAEFRVALAGRLSAEQIGTLVDGLDVARFMTDDGQPDAERIGAYVAAIPTGTAPVVAAGPQVTASQGVRPAVKASGLGEGASLYADRHAKRAPSTT